ncbi:Calponin domain [Trinorchestia longiramus]|nr:Calponin domain [Trinorchestia longiramus]
MGDISQMISTPLLSEVTQMPNGVSSHSFNKTDDLDDDTSNASLYLINQIASSLSNPQTMNAPSPHRRLSATLDRQHEPVASPLSCDTRTVHSPSLPDDDSASFLPSYKRVSKLNKRNPVISSMLEENPQFVTDPVNTRKNSDSARIPLFDFSDPTFDDPHSERADTADQKEFHSDEMVEDCVKEDKVPTSLIHEVTSASNDLDPLVSDMESSVEPMMSNTTISSRKNSEVTDSAEVLQVMETPYSHPPLSHTTSSSSGRSALEDENDSSILLLEKRSFRPFKNPEDYLYAMREDLAEWLNSMYELDITADNFFEKLETGEVLCQHANSVRVAAEEAARNGRRLSGRWSVPRNDVVWRPGVEPGSFRARDNVSNFIRWCRQLGVHEVLLFETDDLVLRKNEKHVILALLEVARQGYKLGMAAPLLVQMEDDIDRHERLLEERRVLQESLARQESLSASQEQMVLPAEPEEPPQIFYGPTKQIVTNDLRSLDEMLRTVVLVHVIRCSSLTMVPSDITSPLPRPSLIRRSVSKERLRPDDAALRRLSDSCTRLLLSAQL